MAQENVLAFLRIALPDGTVRTEQIMQTPFSLGRVAGNDVVLPDPKVSRNHARLLVEGDRIHLIDLNSTNGTLVGDAQLEPNQPHALNYNEKFQIGRYSLYLEPGPAATAEQKAEPLADTAIIAGDAHEPPSGAAPRADQVPAAEVEPVPEPAPPVRLGATAAPPPPPSRPEPPPSLGEELPPYDQVFGLPTDKSRYLRYLPPIYEEFPFLGNFLLVLEGILTPIEQTVDNFDLYLDPDTVPTYFLSQLAGWLGMTLDEKWPGAKQRALVGEAAELYRRRGTRWSLSRHLEIYAEATPQISEPEDRPHHFHVLLRVPTDQAVDRTTVERIIEANKPAHATYSLEILAREQKEAQS